MRTTRPISTISFNSSAFLEVVLDDLKRAGVITFWAFVTHFPEDDEGGKKEHHHLYVELSKLTQTDNLTKELTEYIPGNNKPLKCIAWRISKFDDWYLYSLHNREYLVSKGQSRRFEYRHDDFLTSDEDDFLFRAKSIDRLSISPYASMMDAIRQGQTFAEFFRRGTVPLNQVIQMEKAWNLLVGGVTFRNGREGHENSP